MATKLEFNSNPSKIAEIRTAIEKHIANDEVDARHLTKEEYYAFKRLVKTKMPSPVIPSVEYVPDTISGYPKPANYTEVKFIPNDTVKDALDNYFIQKMGANEYDKRKRHIYGIEYPRFECPMPNINVSGWKNYQSDWNLAINGIAQYNPVKCTGMLDSRNGADSGYEENAAHTGFYDNNSGFFKKLCDNVIEETDGDTTVTRGRRAVFVEFGALNEDANGIPDPDLGYKHDAEYRNKDEYCDLPFFTDFKCFYGRDINGHRMCRAIEGITIPIAEGNYETFSQTISNVTKTYEQRAYEFSPEGKRTVYAEGTDTPEARYDQDVGILALTYYIKQVKAYNTVDYPVSQYPGFYSTDAGGYRTPGQTDQFGRVIPDGYPVWRIYVSLVKPDGTRAKKDWEPDWMETTNEDSPYNPHGWEICSAAKRYLEETDEWIDMPYVIRSPYGLGSQRTATNGTAWSSARGVYTQGNRSCQNMQTVKGYGGSGFSAEIYAWAMINMLLKYGNKSVQKLALGSQWKTLPGQAPNNMTDEMKLGKPIVAVHGLSIEETQAQYSAFYFDHSINDYALITSHKVKPGSVVSIRSNASENWGGSYQTAVIYNPNHILSNGTDHNHAITTDRPRKALSTAIVDSIVSTEYDYNGTHYYVDQITFKQMNDETGQLEPVKFWTGSSGEYSGQTSTLPRMYINALTTAYIAGTTDIIDSDSNCPIHQDGCLGVWNSSYSVYRMRMLEFGMGLWDIPGNEFTVNNGGNSLNKKSCFVSFPKRYLPNTSDNPIRKSYTVLNDTGVDYVVLLNHDNAGRHRQYCGGTAEMEFELAAKQYSWNGTYTYIEGMPIWTDPQKCGVANTINPGVETGNSWGDQFWNAGSGNTTYELLLCGGANYGASCGLAFCYANSGFGLAAGGIRFPSLRGVRGDPLE